MRRTRCHFADAACECDRACAQAEEAARLEKEASAEAKVARQQLKAKRAARDQCDQEQRQNKSVRAAT